MPGNHHVRRGISAAIMVVTAHTPITVGRHANCDLWLHADFASRRHLVFVAHGTALAAVDLVVLDDAEEGPDAVRVFLSPQSARDFANRSNRVISAGRPPCRSSQPRSR